MGFLDLFKKKKPIKRKTKRRSNNKTLGSKPSFIEFITKQLLTHGNRLSKHDQDILELKQQLAKVQSEVHSAPSPQYSPKQTTKSVAITLPGSIKASINALYDHMPTSKMEDLIVRQKKLCGKTTFYKYLNIIKFEVQSGVRSTANIKNKKEKKIVI